MGEVLGFSAWPKKIEQLAFTTGLAEPLEGFDLR
jgi:hypothetical protein